MGNGIAHLLSRSERYLRMQLCEAGESSRYAMACFSDYLDIADDGVLDESIGQEELLI